MKLPPHGLIASVQASGNEPLNQPDHIVAMALSCLHGGAVGLRLSDVEAIRRLRQLQPDTFIIGLSKPEPLPPKPAGVVYITPTFEDAKTLAMAGADMIALDATLRPRPEPLAVIIHQFQSTFPGLGLMADVATLEDGLAAEQTGFDVVSTTLSGYTDATLKRQALGPDFDMLAALRTQTRLPVILEGRVWTPTAVAKAFQLGAHAVVIGSAISRPQHIVQHFLSAL